MTEDIIIELFEDVYLQVNSFPPETTEEDIRGGFLNWVEEILDGHFSLDAVDQLNRLQKHFDESPHQDNFQGWVYQVCQQFILEYKSPPSPPMARIIEALRG